MCVCGQSVDVLRHSLIEGRTNSCGCWMRERSAEEIILRSTTHGMRQSVEYRTWSGIKRRCENQNDKSFLRYGGAGIVVLYRTFEDFFADVGPKPGPGFSIDRIDNNRGYEPGNVRWATRSQQARNTRNAVIVTVDGHSSSLADLCEARGVPYKRAWERIKKLGWTPSRALGLRP